VTIGQFESIAPGPGLRGTPSDDQVTTSRVCGGVLDDRAIPTALKTQLLELKWTELN